MNILEKLLCKYGFHKETEHPDWHFRGLMVICSRCEAEGMPYMTITDSMFEQPFTLWSTPYRR